MSFSIILYYLQILILGKKLPIHILQLLIYFCTLFHDILPFDVFNQLVLELNGRTKVLFADLRIRQVRRGFYLYEFEFNYFNSTFSSTLYRHYYFQQKIYDKLIKCFIKQIIELFPVLEPWNFLIGSWEGYIKAGIQQLNHSEALEFLF